MKKLLLLMAATISFPLSLSAHCGSCDGDKKCDKSAECEVKIEDSFKKYDADKDGKLSLEEFKALATDYLKECDTKKCDTKKCDTEKCADKEMSKKEEMSDEKK